MSEITKKRKKRSTSSGRALNGTTAKNKPAPSKKGNTLEKTAIELGTAVLFALGGAVAGAALGKISLVPGLGTMAWGVHKGMPNLSIAGATMALASGYKRNDKAVNGLDGDEDNYGTDGIGGISIENATAGVKARVGNWAANFSEKLILIPGKKAEESKTSKAIETATQPTNGLENTEWLPPLEETYQPMNTVIGNVAGFGNLGNADGNVMLGYQMAGTTSL